MNDKKQNNLDGPPEPTEYVESIRYAGTGQDTNKSRPWPQFVMSVNRKGKPSLIEE